MKALQNLFFITVVFIAITTGCGHAQVKVPAWYGSMRTAPGYYYGMGEGGSYDAARTAALGGLCKSIHVNIKTSMKIVSQQMVSGENNDQKVFFRQMEESINRASARCSFKGRISRLIREVRSKQQDGRYYVVLKMSMVDYVRFLAQRTVVIEVRPNTAASLTEPLTQVILDDLRDDDFVVVEQGGNTPHFRAELLFEPKITATGLGGLKNGSVQPVYKLVNTKNQRLIKHVCLGTFTAHGFDESMITRKLVEDATNALQKKTGRTGD